MEKIYCEVHCYDCKGKQHRLDHISDRLKSIGIEVFGTDFNDYYDGFVKCNITLEQAILLDKEYGSKLYIIGRGKTIEELFNDALRIEKMHL